VPEPRSSDLTSLLTRVGEGDERASEELLLLVYDELRKLAHSFMAKEEPGQTLQPTALVHEAYLRLRGSAKATWKNRAHFFAAAAEAMRRILVERARRYSREKHGAGQRRVPLSQATVDWDTDPGELLDLDRALGHLEELDPKMTEVVKLRYFTGLTVEETARALDISARTVKRHWSRAKLWLYRELGGAAR
jgi:RNA polymerase sigma factor (TIGR02999 family)